MKIPERFLWAIDVMNIRPDDSILEIGCGAGLLAEQTAAGLVEGKYTGLDKSAAMIRLAEKRNRHFIASGKSSFVITDFADFQTCDTYNKIAAFNVNFFWKNPGKEFVIIRKLLKPGGQLYIFYQPPYQIDSNAAVPLTSKLETALFKVNDIFFKKMTPNPALCIVAEPI